MVEGQVRGGEPLRGLGALRVPLHPAAYGVAVPLWLRQTFGSPVPGDNAA